MHEGCPINCSDVLTWLPTAIANHILSFLDPGNAKLRELFYLYMKSVILVKEKINLSWEIMYKRVVNCLIF